MSAVSPRGGPLPETRIGAVADGWVRTPRRGIGNVSEPVLAVLLLLPAALLLALIVVVPIGRLVWLSFHELRLAEPWLGQPFVGLLNYQDVLADPRFWATTWTTAVIVLVTVPGALIVGLGLAMLANLPFRTKWPTRLALLFPWALPLVFAGLVFAWFFDSSYGIVNDLLRRVGLGPYLWLSTPNLAMFGICTAIIWKTSSFCALILLAGLQTIPAELYESAEIDGAKRWQRFWHVTLPLLRPAIAVALIFRTVTAIQTFDIPYAMTRGGPGTTTETLAMYIHTTTLDFLDFGYGSALAVMMFLIAMLATVWYLRQVRGVEG